MVDLAVLGQWLDIMIIETISNTNDFYDSLDFPDSIKEKQAGEKILHFCDNLNARFAPDFSLLDCIASNTG